MLHDPNNTTTPTLQPAHGWWYQSAVEGELVGVVGGVLTDRRYVIIADIYYGIK